MIDIVETVYRGASKGRGLVVSPKGKRLVLSRLAQRGLTALQITLPGTDTRGRLILLLCRARTE